MTTNPDSVEMTDHIKTCDTLLEFFTRTKGVNVQWKLLGLWLKLNIDDLETIEHDNPKDSTTCRLIMLNAWLKTNPANPEKVLNSALTEMKISCKINCELA